jgi:copper transport protein
MTFAMSLARTVAAAFLIILCASVGTAFAHAQLVASDPVDGAVVTEAPPVIILTFSEPVSPLVFRVTTPAGTTMDLPPTAGQAEGSRLVVPFSASLGAAPTVGTYSLSWRVTSQDGHPIGGGILFSVGQGSTPASASASAGTSTAAADPRVGLWAFRLLAMAGLVIGVGGAGWLALLDIRPRRYPERLVPATFIAGLLATPFWIAFQGLDALGESLGALATPAVWIAGLSATSYGRAALIGALAMVCALVSLHLAPGRARQSLAALAFLLAGLVAASAGHAATAAPRLATVPAIFLHMLATTAWIGSLLPLLAVLWPLPAKLDVAALIGEAEVRRLLFVSRVLPIVFAVLAGSGLFLAVVQVQAVQNLWQTGYGRVLLAKLAVVAIMVALATYNRFSLTRPAADGDARALRRLRRSIAFEVVLGCVVLAILGLWRFTPPSRALISAAPPAIEHLVEADGLKARLSITPPHTGPVSIVMTGLESDGRPIDPLSVTVDLVNPDKTIGPFVREAVRLPEGGFRADGFVLPVAGRWRARITVLVDDFHSVDLEQTFEIAPTPSPVRP